MKRLKFYLNVGVLFGLNSVFNGQNRHIISSFTAEGGVWRHRILVSNAKKGSLNSSSKDRESEIKENEIRTLEK